MRERKRTAQGDVEDCVVIRRHRDPVGRSSLEAAQQRYRMAAIPDENTRRLTSSAVLEHEGQIVGRVELGLLRRAVQCRAVLGAAGAPVERVAEVLERDPGLRGGQKALQRVVYV